MFNKLSEIDLSSLPLPNIVEPLNFEDIYSNLKQLFLTLTPEKYQEQVNSTLTLDSEPLAILLQLCAYRELNLRQRINDATRAVMLAFAVNSDLDQIGANKGVKRLVMEPADDSAIPPKAAVYESDDSFRKRIQMSPEGYSCAGPFAAYKFYALSASGQIKDVSVIRPRPGDIAIYVLTYNNQTDENLLDAVSKAVNDEEVRPLNDTVTVYTADIIHYTIQAEIIFYPGLNQADVLKSCQQATQQYAQDNNILGRDITLSGIIKSLKQNGVQDIRIQQPTSNIIVASHQTAVCTQITLTEAGTNE